VLPDIRYALVFFLLQGVFAYLGTALADWVGRRPSATLAALTEVASTVLAATSDSLAEYQVFGRNRHRDRRLALGGRRHLHRRAFPNGPARHRLRDRSWRWPHRLDCSSYRDRLGHHAIRATDAVFGAGRSVGLDVNRLPARTRDERQKTRRPCRRGPHRRSRTAQGVEIASPTTQLVAPATGRRAGPPAPAAVKAAAVIPLPLCVGGITCSLRPLGTWRLRHS
jgi:hypothetical protein